MFDIVLVEPAQFDQVETCRASVDIADVEQFDHLFAREDFLIAMRPAQADQVVEHRVRQKAVARYCMTPTAPWRLVSFCPSGPEDHRQMGEGRHLAGPAPYRH